METVSPMKIVRARWAVILVLAIAALYTTYFSLAVSYFYSSFHEGADTGLSAYGLYYNTHFLNPNAYLQHLVFDQHVSFDSLLVQLAYLLVPSAMTVLELQLIFQVFAALLVFLIARDLTKNDFIGLALFVAFILNLGNLGLILADTHVEFLITAFYLLTFYFYMKRSVVPFAVSLALLLGSADVSALMALMLGIGLLAYELLGKFQGRTSTVSWWFAISIVAGSAVAILGYGWITASLASGYVSASSAYSSVPIVLRVTNGAQTNVGPSFGSFLKNPVGVLASNINTYLQGYKTDLIYSLLLVVLGIGGVAMFFDPIVALLLISPWLAGAFIMGNPAFLLPTQEYFGYVLGPAVCAAIIGIMLRSGRKGIWQPKAIGLTAIGFALVLSVIGPAVYLLTSSSVSNYHTATVGNLPKLLTLSSNSSQREAYLRLDYMIKQVPKNASLLTDFFIMPHVANREYLDTFSDKAFSFKAEYILVDLNRSANQQVCLQENCSIFYNMIAGANYTVLIQNGTATLYRKS
ncbi:MAG: DUF2079 domain-containing protein [Candidatus Micrarchaeota archaeon]|nr:DUF2079 domain-containing protein [Candidatus Micrarchaeota archaeon]